MFTREDFKISNTEDLGEFLVILPFVMVIAPFLFLAYQIGLVLDLMGLLDES